MNRESRASSESTRGEAIDPSAAAAIVSRMAEGDADAVADLHGLARSKVYGHCRRILGDGAAAEEVTMDVFVQAWRQAGRFDATRGQPGTWLLTIARSRAVDRLRSEKRSTRLEDALESAGELVCPAADPEAGVALSQRAHLVRSALQTLKPPQRRAIELAFFEGLTCVEMAERLSAPLGTIKSRIRAGLRDLRKSLSGTGLDSAFRHAPS